MLIALLAVLGVDLIVIVAVVAIVVARRRWLRHQPGAFRGAIRLSDGALPWPGTKWKRGSGRWVSNVFVWSKAPFMFRNEFVVVDGPPIEQHHDGPGIKRLGDDPVVFELRVDEATIEVAAKGDDRALAGGTSAPVT